MYPNTNLSPGQTGPEVKKLQDFLVSQGLMTTQQVATGPGIYGPQTTAAVKKYQEMKGVDNSSGPGYWGPRTIAAASGGIAPSSSIVNGKVDKSVLDRIDQEIIEKSKANPIINQYTKAGNTPESLLNAYLTGDFSQTVNEYGQPFTVEEQKQALRDAEEMDRAFFEAQKQKDTADAEASLAQKQADWQNYLITSGEQFQEDKTKADQSAADRGVLFSGARVQKEKNLQKAYEQDQSYKLGSLGRDVASTASDYQYKYGNKAAKGLSDYYKFGSNTFNPNVATGGVGSTSLSSVYNPSKFDYKGTMVGTQAATAQQQAAKLLANKSNKFLSTGYSNKLY